MKDKIKRYMTLMVFVAGIILVIWGGYMAIYRENQISQTIGQLKLKETILTKHRDQLSREFAEFKAASFSRNDLDHIGDSTVMILKSELKYWKSLASHTSVEMTTGDTIKAKLQDTTYKTPDSVVVHARSFKWNDTWLSMWGTVTQEDVTVGYSLKNSVSLDYYWKHDNWWKKPYLAGTIMQSNPRTTTDRVIQFTVAQPAPAWYRKWWVHELIGLGAGGTIVYFLMK